MNVASIVNTTEIAPQELPFTKTDKKKMFCIAIICHSVHVPLFCQKEGKKRREDRAYKLLPFNRKIMTNMR